MKKCFTRAKRLRLVGHSSKSNSAVIEWTDEWTNKQTDKWITEKHEFILRIRINLAYAINNHIASV